MVYCVSERERRAVVARRGVRCATGEIDDGKDGEEDISTRGMPW